MRLLGEATVGADDPPSDQATTWVEKYREFKMLPGLKLLNSRNLSQCEMLRIFGHWNRCAVAHSAFIVA